MSQTLMFLATLQGTTILEAIKLKGSHQVKFEDIWIAIIILSRGSAIEALTTENLTIALR